MADSPKRPGRKASDDHEDDFGGNALTELMTGAYAATSMVAMSVDPDQDIPALPEWEPPTTKPPSVELLDEAGAPVAIDSGDDFIAIPAADSDFDIDAEPEEDAPALSGSLLQSSDANEAGTQTEPIVKTVDVEDLPDEPLSVGSSVPARAPFTSLAAATAPLPSPPSTPKVVVNEPTTATESESESEPENEPLATMTDEPGVVVRSERAPATDFTGSYDAVAAQIRSPSPKPDKSPWPRVLGVAGAIGVVALIGWAWSRTAPMPSADTQAQVAPTTTVDSKPARPPQPPPPEAAPKPNDGAPAASDKAASQAYAAAKAEYDESEAQDALITMVESACQLEDGPTARTAFRKLIGSKLRSQALLNCREFGVDVTAEGEGFTASELADQAQIALDGDKADEALELAKKSNRTDRNDRALRLIVMSSCQLKKRQNAKKMLRHVAEKNRGPVVEFCAKAGVKL